MGEPISIYRFLDSDAALKTIVARKFRVGRLSNFNDLFEWQVGFKGITTPEEQKVADEIKAEHVPWLDKWIGILCFSDSESVFKPVLWSLYAEKHRGVAFEIKYPWLDDHLYKMAYSDERPVFDFSQWRKIHDDETRNEYLLSLLDRLRKQKSSGWHFEREYRVFIDLNDLKHCQLADGWHFWQIPDNALQRVVLGFRCPLEEVTVRKLLDMNGLMNTKVTRAEMCSETYVIRYQHGHCV
jgi:hypothetical protein